MREYGVKLTKEPFDLASCYWECKPLVSKCKLQYRVVSMHQMSPFLSEPSAFAIHLLLAFWYF